jgi:hypothetical protein
MTHTHVIVAYDRINQAIASVTPASDDSLPPSTSKTHHTVWTWDRWYSVRRSPAEKEKR